MKNNKFRYYIISLAVIVVTLVLFLFENSDMQIFKNSSLLSIIILIFSVIAVHTIKAARLYLALYGTEVDSIAYLKTYCKVTPVSVVLPFKLGEFFRMYCYGKQIGNILKGSVIVLLDRFMDTIALVTVFFLLWIFYGGQITSFAYVLLIFLAFVLLVYYIFPNAYLFWKRYILRAKATENKLSVLKMLDAMNLIYQELVSVSKGRGIILYCMSLLAWGVEIGSIAIMMTLSKETGLDKTISEYITSAISGNQSVELQRFVFVSVILMIVIYSIIKLTDLIIGKRGHKK